MKERIKKAYHRVKRICGAALDIGIAAAMLPVCLIMSAIETLIKTAVHFHDTAPNHWRIIGLVLHVMLIAALAVTTLPLIQCAHQNLINTVYAMYDPRYYAYGYFSSAFAQMLAIAFLVGVITALVSLPFKKQSDWSADCAASSILVAICFFIISEWTMENGFSLLDMVIENSALADSLTMKVVAYTAIGAGCVFGLLTLMFTVNAFAQFLKRGENITRPADESNGTSSAPATIENEVAE